MLLPQQTSLYRSIYSTQISQLTRIQTTVLLSHKHGPPSPEPEFSDPSASLLSSPRNPDGIEFPSLFESLGARFGGILTVGSNRATSSTALHIQRSLLGNVRSPLLSQRRR